MKKTIWIFSLEMIPSRYTWDWFHDTRRTLEKELVQDFNIRQINGKTMPGPLKNGEFLDFVSTNTWKSEQAILFFEMIKNDQVKKGDHVLFMDAWNPIITQIKYVSDLRNMDLVLSGLWHAGVFDPHDFLGRLCGDKKWIQNLEVSLYECLDHNFFATEFSWRLFWNKHFQKLITPEIELMMNQKTVITGWPFEYAESNIRNKFTNPVKRDLILFPHRIAPEKQVEIFRDLAKEMPEYEWIVCQDSSLSKEEYNQLLMESKMVFSCSKQETLGISICLESVIADSMPLAPNRLSYKEIFKNHNSFLYESAWTENWDSYLKYKKDLIVIIKYQMSHHEQMLPIIKDYREKEMSKYFTFTNAIQILKGYK
jgi:hypothetical protein